MAEPAKHIVLSAEEEATLEEGGGIKKETQNDRDRFDRQFKDYCLEITSRTVHSLLSLEEKTPEVVKVDRAVLSNMFSKFFWTLRVTVTRLWYESCRG